MSEGLDKFLQEVKSIITTIEAEQPILDFGVHYTQKPFIFSEYVLCVEIANIYGTTLDKIKELGYEINLIEPMTLDSKQIMRVFFKKK